MSNTLQPERIDELTLWQHNQLTSGDRCFYLGAYDPANDSFKNPIRSIIHNLKKAKGKKGYKYKLQDIEYLGQQLCRLFDDEHIVIPAPPSKIKSSPDYDPRLTKILESAHKYAKKNNKYLNFLELILQKENREPKHMNNGARPSFSEQKNWYYLDEDLIDTFEDHLKKHKSRVVIFDDVLTTGATFKALEFVLKERCPKIKVTGLFIARIIHPHSFASDEDFDYLA